jgi:AAA+ ATPase superfamily predicted ATPase
LLTATANISDPVIIVDLRTLLELPYGSKKELIQEIERAFNIHYSRQLGMGKKLLNWLEKVRGVQISDRGLTLAWGCKDPVDLAELFHEMNSWAVKEKKLVIIAFDEAQELRKVAGVESRKFFAHLYDHCLNITIILTGSEVGFLYDFLGEEKEETPLFGRHIVRISLESLPPEKARDFLTRGFKQAKIKVSDPSILDSATERLDGIIGWLNLFGVASVETSMPSDESIEYATRIGKSISMKEFNNFLKDKVARSRYEAIMRFLASNPLSTWSLIKRSIETEEGRKISDTRFADLLSKLVDSSFVIKNPEAAYTVADPLLAEAFSLRKKRNS